MVIIVHNYYVIQPGRGGFDKAHAGVISTQ